MVYCKIEVVFFRALIAFALFFPCANVNADSFEAGMRAYGKNDYSTALIEFKKAASQNDSLSQLILGEMYAQGIGVKKDMEEAIRWYQLAVKKRDVPKIEDATAKMAANEQLGRIYYLGEGVDKDYQAALMYARQAAKDGAVQSQNLVALMHEHGQGTIQDYQAALKCWLLSAQSGDSEGLFKVGMYYVVGFGVKQDNLKGHMWLNLAGAKGNEKAIKARVALESQMSLSDVLKAQELARKCIENHYFNCSSLVLESGRIKTN